MGLLDPFVQITVNITENFVRDQAAPKDANSVLVVQQVGPTVRGPKAPGTNSTQRCGTVVQWTMASGLTGTLGADLGGRQRLPKPRSAKFVDEIKWSNARHTALSEVVKEFSVPSDIKEYYTKMESRH